MEKENVKVVIDVVAKDYKNGVAISAFEADVKITKAEVNNGVQRDEDRIVIVGSTCGNPAIEANYNSIASGKATAETRVEFDLKGKTFNKEKNQLVEGFTASANLKKESGVIAENKSIEDWFKLKAAKDCGAECASVESYYTTKTNEIV